MAARRSPSASRTPTAPARSTTTRSTPTTRPAPTTRSGRGGTVTSTRQASKTVPGLSTEDGNSVGAELQTLLVAYIDLALTLKHIHWNVVGPAFIGVHEMLDPQVLGVQAMVDAAAERIATVGGSPNGLPGNLVATRTWDDYDLHRADVQSHLAALDLVYAGIIGSARDALDRLDELDPITHDLVVAHVGQLEQYQWFVRAHLEDPAGGFVHSGATEELAAATKASRARR